eukprot:TRINITY_DN3584_c0_g1_i2.p1 TRINITY_DN3584_c0_g1~~TRINITY_DN3584_c0_g1_i2.p1  ORF type:complete len:1107 (+),score=249.53 TRINITY_DN3584_c0_g1_i2:122-3442(+)
MDDLARMQQIEALCVKLYEFRTAEERSEAEKALSPFSLSPEYVQQAKLLLDNATSPYAQHFAASSITKLVTKFWNSFTTDVRFDMRNTTLAYLGTNCSKLQPFVLTAVLQLICRITKLAWIDDPRQHNIVDEVTKFLKHTPEYYIVGLRLLNQLVVEFNEITSAAGQTWSEHRKISNSFRDKCMLPIFKISITSLVELFNTASPTPTTDVLKDQALELAHRCLTYDFVGTSPDDSVDDLTSVQAPSSWKTLFEDDTTIKLFLSIYMNSPTPRSTQALQCLAQIASIRSLFNEAEREKFLLYLIQASRDILSNVKSQGSLNEQVNHHEFCRFLARLKGNFGASTIVAVPGYSEWINQVAIFTMNSFTHWKWSPNSVFFLLTFWSRLVLAVYYIKNKDAALIESLVPQIMQAYFTARMEAIQLQITGDAEDVNEEEEEQLIQQLEALPHLGRLKYETTRNYFISVFDPIMQNFNRLAEQPKSKEFKVIEAQLGALVEWIGCIVGGRQSIVHSSEEHDIIDAELSSRIFDFIRTHLPNPSDMNPRPSNSAKLELSLLTFVENFRRAYVSDQSSNSSKVYTKLSELVGMSDPQSVLLLFVTKLAFNLRFWTKNEKILYQTLKELSELVIGYSSSKILLKLDITSQFFSYHTSQFFPFLDIDSNKSLRSLYYSVLARLLFFDDNISRFESFMEPFRKIFLLLKDQPIEVFRTPDCKRAIARLFKDLQGVVEASTSKRSYLLLLDWMYNYSFPYPFPTNNLQIFQQTSPTDLQDTNPPTVSNFFVISKAVEALYDCGEVMSPVLKFVSEFVFSKSGRISFDPSSVSGILLFREISNILVSYGRRAISYQLPPGTDPYNEKYKQIAHCLVTLSRTLVGNYVNFGVFRLYGDRCFDEAVAACITMAFSIPLRDLLSYPKVTKAYFFLFDTLCEKHTTVLVKLDDTLFLQLLHSIKEGLNSPEVGIVSQCCSIVDRIVSYRERERDKEREREREGERAADRAAAVGILNSHLAAHADLVNAIFTMLLQNSLDFKTQNLWSYSRPLLALILLNQEHFNTLKNQLIAAQPLDRRQQLIKDFENLMKDIKPNLDFSNRDKFSQNFNAFVQEVRKYLVV